MNLRPPAATGQTCLLRLRGPDKMSDLKVWTFPNNEPLDGTASRGLRTPGPVTAQVAGVCLAWPQGKRGWGGSEEGTPLFVGSPAPTLLFSLLKTCAPSVSPPRILST